MMQCPSLVPSKSRADFSAGRALLAAAVAAGTGWAALAAVPALELGLFARATAWLAGVFTGAGVAPVAEGWMLVGLWRPVVVSPACSATDFFLIVAALVSWRLARSQRNFLSAVVLGLGAALPLAIFVNALRVATLVQVHRWIIPRLPETYGAFLHLLAGMAIFLPSLILLNLLLEFHERYRRPSVS